MTIITQAVILAGGRGERLLPFTLERPKPMILFHGKPFLAYLVELLVAQGITDIVLLLGYLPEQIMDFFGDGSKWGIRIQYSVTDVDDDTGSRLRRATHLLADYFLCMYCDNFWPLDLRALERFYDKMGKKASVVVYSNKGHFSKNNMLVQHDGMVVTYDKSRTIDGLNGVEIGFYILEKSIVSFIPPENVSFEGVVLPHLIELHQLAGYITDKLYYSVSTPERLEGTENFLFNLEAIAAQESE